MWLLDFDPFLPWPVIAICALLAAALAALLMFHKVRGAWLRTLALALGLLALTNPVLVEEERTPLDSFAAILVDESGSQSLDERTAQSKAALEKLEAELAKIPNLKTRVIKTKGDDSRQGGTALFSALRENLQDVPPDRLAGAIIISDGEIHDVPTTLGKFGFKAPIHGVITGRENEFDLQLEMLEAPRYSIIEEPQRIRFRVNTTDISRGRQIQLNVRLNGERVTSEIIAIGEEAELNISLDRGGENVLEIEVEELEGELTAINNKAVMNIQGIRENLRVLLVSGEPHPGERTWRNLLKSDGMVDLVHFTILRPPEKQDGTPINQLSLIAFPTRELFAQKINEFDLIIFDRYQRRNVLPVLYFDNIAQYVQQGGAILIAAGPDYAVNGTIYDTPLAEVLPAAPTGTIYENPFHARISETGYRHPVTRNLNGAGKLNAEAPPNWSRWFRSVDVEGEITGDVVMTGADERPLLILNRENEGRVALMLSDHAWLWARGFEGGGPHVQLLRRLGHWLMKEPDLEEESLRGFAEQQDLMIERQTMADTVEDVIVAQPDGTELAIKLEEKESGLWQGRLSDPQVGLYQLKEGDLTTLAHIGPQNPKEYQKVVSTLTKLQPLAKLSGGLVKRIDERGTIPRITALKGISDDSRRALSGRDWMGLKMTNASTLTGVNRLPLFAGLLGLALLLGAFATLWYREGR